MMQRAQPVSRLAPTLFKFVLGLGALLTGAAQAQVPPAQTPVQQVPPVSLGTQAISTRQISDTDAAELLIKAGKLDDAKRILETRTNKGADDSETLFLLGLIATAQKDYNKAISLFRRILANEPDAERVRLELARAFFLKGDYDNATIQFRRARAGNVPDAVKANIDHYLAALNRGKEWSYGFTFALAPDTNENIATSAQQVTLYGLPFTLDQSARAKSGIGLYADINGEYAPNLSDWVKPRIGADLSTTDYTSGIYDSTILSPYLGVQFSGDNWNVSPLLTGTDWLFGNRPYMTGWGGKINATYGIASSWQTGIQLGAQSLNYLPLPEQSGPLYSLQLSGAHAFSPSSALQVMMGYNRDQATDPAFAFNGYWASIAYQRDLPMGFSANFQPSYYLNDYDGQYSAFGVTRGDHILVLHLDILNRLLDYDGFTPKFSYTFTDEVSNISIYRYTRSQFQLGFTSQF